jgi:ubiquinone biosynthesis protein COQ9
MTPPERSPERDAALEAMLPNVPFDGWTRRALRRGLADIGLPAEDAELLFPGGAAAMIEAFCDWADRRMEAAAASLDTASLRTHERVRAVILLRLEQNRPFREAIRRALALLALPANAGLAACCTARRCDLARRRRPFGRLQLVHQKGDPDRRLRRDRAVLAARQQRRRHRHARLP